MEGKLSNHSIANESQCYQISLKPLQHIYISHYLPRGFSLHPHPSHKFKRYNSCKLPTNKEQRKHINQQRRDEQESNILKLDFSNDSNRGQSLARSYTIYEKQSNSPTIQRQSMKKQKKKLGTQCAKVHPKSSQEIDTQLGQQFDVCLQILKQLKKSRYSWPFKQPVDPIELNIPNYFDIIKDPMDLNTIELKIKKSKYNNSQQFHIDINKIIRNSYIFNQDNTDFIKITAQFQKDYIKIMAKLEILAEYSKKQEQDINQKNIVDLSQRIQIKQKTAKQDRSQARKKITTLKFIKNKDTPRKEVEEQQKKVLEQ